LEPEIFVFLEEGFKSINKPFPKNINGHLFLKHLFFFIGDEIEFLFSRRKPGSRPVPFYRDLFDGTPLVFNVSNIDALSPMQRDFTVRSVNLFSSFYNWSFPPEAWKYEPFKPKAIENIEQDYNF